MFHNHWYETQPVQLDLYVMSNFEHEAVSFHTLKGNWNVFICRRAKCCNELSTQSLRDRRLITGLHTWPSHHGPLLSICPPATGHLYTFLIDSSIYFLVQTGKSHNPQTDRCLTARTIHPAKQPSTGPSAQPNAQEPTTLWNQCSTAKTCWCPCWPDFTEIEQWVDKAD